LVIQTSISYAQRLLSDYGVGIQYVDSPADADFVFNRFTVAGDLGGTNNILAFGEASSGIGINENDYHDLFRRIENISQAEQNYRLAHALNNKGKGNATIFPLLYFVIDRDITLTAQRLGTTLGKTFAHELGHLLGLYHTYNQNLQKGFDPGYRDAAKDYHPFDIMAQGDDFHGEARWFFTKNALRMALGMDWTPGQGDQAIGYYLVYRRTGGDYDAPPEEIAHHNEGPGILVHGALAALLTRDPTPDDLVRTTVRHVDFGAVDVAAGGRNLPFVLQNEGDQPLTLSQVRVDGGGGQFTVTNVPGGQVVPPGGELPITLTFHPSTIGPSNATLVVQSNSLDPVVDFSLAGFGQTATPHHFVQAFQNNLGGVHLGKGPVQTNQLVTIINQGAAPLILSDIHLMERGGPFTLLCPPTWPRIPSS
jgi:hypothetical protein